MAIPTVMDSVPREPKVTESLPRLGPRMQKLREAVGQALTPGPRLSSG